MKSTVYSDDLAYIHDAGFGHFARAAADVLLAELGDQPRCQIVDLGCGSGILAERLEAAGHRVLGIDLSRPMLSLARGRAPKSKFRLGSLLDAELPACSAVAIVGECCNYQFVRGNTRAGLARLFRRIYTALAPGGFLLADVAGPGRGGGAGSRQIFRTGDDWAVLVATEEFPDQKKLVRHITSFRQFEAGLYRRRSEAHTLRLFEPELWAQLLTAAGFRPQRLSSYGSQKLPPGYNAFIARKQGDRGSA